MNQGPHANRLTWNELALSDREAICDFIAQDNPLAALELDEHFEAEAELARRNPLLYKPGRKRGTRELVAHPNYVMVYLPTKKEGGYDVEILRVLHTAQQWPAKK